MLRVAQSLIEQIHKHGIRDYPNECCGALLGREEEGHRTVLGLLPLMNQRNDSPRNRFSITSEDVRLAEKEAKAKGWELIGWYHSHPDSPARPSEFDREHAWPWYSYIIFQVANREPREMRSWRLDDDRAKYAEESIEFISGGPR
ncbi:MAG TPA: M67 family metallopeptidase [Candidatus Acidoferrales bacterium]|nr:M67 family metallopeptidase [Candidatus Acidoferrales bacterium]